MSEKQEFFWISVDGIRIQVPKVAPSEAASAMREESDRGLLLVGLSSIDEILEEKLQSYLQRHGALKDAKWLLDPKAGNRPLGTLAVRTRMARCLGIIGDEVRTVIDAMRSIRNTHAHGTKRFEFTDPIMSPVMSSWSHENRERIASIVAESKLDANVARKKFALSIAMLTCMTVCDRVFDLGEGEVGVEIPEGDGGGNEQDNSGIEG